MLAEGGGSYEGGEDELSLLEAAKEEMNKARESEELTRRVSGAHVAAAANDNNTKAQ